MKQDKAIATIQHACREIALQFMKIHPAVGDLEDDATKNTCLESLHRMTTDLEVMKKHLLILQKRDDSSDL